MADQMGFPEIVIQAGAARTKALAAELDHDAKEAARGCDRQLLASYLDLSYSYLSEVLNTNGEGKPFKLGMLAGLAELDPKALVEKFITPLLDHCGYEPPVPRAMLTTEQELQRIKERIRAHKLESVLLTDTPPEESPSGRIRRLAGTRFPSRKAG